MPTTPYKPYASVQPSATPPEDYFHIQVSPNTFGGHIATGLEKAGQGMEKAADTWGEVQKDNVLNSAIKEAEAATEDYSKLNGMEAVNAEQGAKDRLDQIAEHYRSQLPPNLAHQFDTAFRPYQYRLLNGKISTHAITQTKDVAAETNKATGQRAGDLAAENYNNPEAVDAAMHTARDATIKQIHIEGNDNVPDIKEQAIKNSDSYVLGRAAEAMFVHNAPEGAAFVEKNRVALGARYTPLAEKFRARATEIASEQRADVLRKIQNEPDPQVKAGIAKANAGVLGDDIVKRFTGEAPAKPPAGNVVQFPGRRAGETEPDYLLRQAKEKTEPKPAAAATPPWKLPPLASPLQRKEGQSFDDWYKENGGKTSEATQATKFAKTETTGNAASGAIDAALRHDVNAHTDRNLFSSGSARRQGIQGGVGQNLTTINVADKPVEVNARAAPHFQGFLNELQSMGYKINTIGGYSNRMKVGGFGGGYSEHAFGNAIDVNENKNEQGTAGDMPPNVGAIAAKYGLIWGGDWHGASRDPMHFEWSGKETRTAGQ